MTAEAAAPLLSVVIPAHDAARFLAECLSSVLAQQRHFELEVIVVDDASNDASAAIARGFERKFECVRLVRLETNQGPAAARNVGIAQARGELIAFLDADDLWPAGSLEARVAVLQRQPAAALVFGDCRQFDDRGPRARTLFEEGGFGAAAWGGEALVPNGYARLLDDNFITTGSVVARRAALTRAGGFAEDLRLVEDLDLWLRLARHSPIAWCARECLQRRRHDANISADAESIALAFLEVLRRQVADWQSGEAAALGVDAKRLAAREWLHLADLARLRGDAATAWRRLWRSVTTHAAPSTQWRAGKTALKLLAGWKSR